MIFTLLLFLISWAFLTLSYRAGYRSGKHEENKRCKEVVMGESILQGEPPEEIATMIKLNPVKSCKIYCETLKRSIVTKLHL